MVFSVGVISPLITRGHIINMQTNNNALTPRTSINGQTAAFGSLFPLLPKPLPALSHRSPEFPWLNLPHMAPSGAAVCPLLSSWSPRNEALADFLRPLVSPEGRGLCHGLACPLLLSVLGQDQKSRLMGLTLPLSSSVKWERS